MDRRQQQVGGGEHAGELRAHALAHGGRLGVLLERDAARALDARRDVLAVLGPARGEGARRGRARPRPTGSARTPGRCARRPRRRPRRRRPAAPAPPRRRRAGCRASSGCRCRSAQTAMRWHGSAVRARRPAPRRAGARRRACAPSGRRGRASGPAGRRRPADPVVGRLQAADAAERGRDADRAAGVGCRARARRRRWPARRRCRRTTRPGSRSGSHGLRHGGKCGLLDVMPQANSCVSVLPTTIAPAALARLTAYGVGGRHVALEELRAVRGLDALGVVEVLDGEREALRAGARCRRGTPARPCAPARGRSRA